MKKFALQVEGPLIMSGGGVVDILFSDIGGPTMIGSDVTQNFLNFTL